MNTRTEKLKDLMLHAPYEFCIERAKWYTESFKQTEGEEPALRMAKALEMTLKKIPIFILDKEQIIGSRTSKLLGVGIPVERGDANNILRVLLKSMTHRKFKPYHISKEEEKLLMDEIFPYWDGKTVSDKKIRAYRKNGLYMKTKTSILKLLKAFRLKNIKNLLDMLRSGTNKVKLKSARYLRQFIMSNSPNGTSTALDDQGHLIMGHGNLLAEGYKSIKQKAIKKSEEIIPQIESEIKYNGGSMNTINNTLEEIVPYKAESEFQEKFSKKNGYNINNLAFLEAVIICCNSASNFILRYSNLAIKKAKREKDPQRKKELYEIAERCNWISNNKPRDFREAIQLVWFNEIMASISHGLGGILALGRPDQYLYPFYQADIKEGRISKNQVLELLEELIIKSGSNIMGLPSFGGSGTDFGTDHVAITVGGVNKDGVDATNDLSYLFVDAFENIKGMTVSFSIRIDPKTSPRLWIERAIETLQNTSGPAFYNDQAIIKALVNNGASIEDARNYAIVGCVEPAPAGCSFPITAGNAVSLTSLLEMLLNDGRTMLGNTLPGLEPFNSKKFQSYEELWNKFKELINLGVNHAVKCSNIKDKIHAENYPNPFISMTLNGCIESALDMTQGGAKYNYNTLSTDGFATVANSLTALKKYVFEDKAISLKKLIKILHKNYKHAEPLQVKLKQKIPKYGNDNEYADEIIKDLANVFCDEINSHPTIRGGQFRPCLFTAGTHTLTGMMLSATPDGRKAGEPVSNSLSPSNNTEKNGPTAVFNSVAKLCMEKMGSGMSLNMRLLPALLNTKENMNKIMNLVRGYFEKGGMHVQFNVVDQEILKEARDNPEDFQDLIVRVSGYNAYFVNLDLALQNDIIDRIQFSGV
ncbi:MAG: pyruvate formate lyase family protein [Promethearchaeia archaeon]